jgi:ribosome-binding factor A
MAMVTSSRVGIGESEGVRVTADLGPAVVFVERLQPFAATSHQNQLLKTNRPCMIDRKP